MMKEATLDEEEKVKTEKISKPSLSVHFSTFEQALEVVGPFGNYQLGFIIVVEVVF